MIQYLCSDIRHTVMCRMKTIITIEGVNLYLTILCGMSLSLSEWR